MQAQATWRFARVSPQKTRLVARNVQGLPVEDALNILRFTPKKSADILFKVLTSAVANAEQTGSDVDILAVKQIIIDGGPKYKRIMPRAMGRAYRILKPTSHITVVVEERDEA